MKICDACEFLEAVRTCVRCGRPLCRDCLRTHLCKSSVVSRSLRSSAEDTLLELFA